MGEVAEAEGEAEGRRAVQRAERVPRVPMPGHSLWSVSQVGTPTEP